MTSRRSVTTRQYVPELCYPLPTRSRDAAQHDLGGLRAELPERLVGPPPAQAHPHQADGAEGSVAAVRREGVRPDYGRRHRTRRRDVATDLLPVLPFERRRRALGRV